MSAEWLIKKGEFYYRPKRSGYTTRKCEAGRYTELDARLEAEIEPWHMSAIHQDTIPDDVNFDTQKIKVLEQQNRLLLDHIETLEARVATLGAALEPFGYEASEDDGSPRKDWAFAPDNEIIGSQFCDLTYGHFRAAREASR